jgi:hypothetical protein
MVSGASSPLVIITVRPAMVSPFRFGPQAVSIRTQARVIVGSLMEEA